MPSYEENEQDMDMRVEEVMANVSSDDVVNEVIHISRTKQY